MNDLMLNDREYYECLSCIEGFANVHELEYNPTLPADVLRVALVMMLSDDCTPEVHVLLGKVIYNMGYRDNYFTGAYIN